MVRQRVLQAVLVILGLLFIAAIYPLVLFYAQEPALAMMMSLYFTLGIFLLLAVRKPAEHRSLIAFVAWSSFAHGGLMGFQAYKKLIPHSELIGVAVMFVAGVVLLALMPSEESSQAKLGQGAPAKVGA